MIIFIQGCAKAGKTTVANNTDTVIPCETAPTTEYLAPVYITDIISSDEYTAFIKSTGEYITVLKDKIRVSDAELVERDFTYAANLSLLSCVSVFGEKTQGSGVIYSIDGTKETAYIVTNYHIIYNREKKSVSNSIYVSLYSMSENNSANPSDYAIKAELIGGTAEYDIAVLKIKHPSLSDSVYSQIKLRQNEVSSGECVIAVGNPCGEGLSVTKGIISSVSEYINIDSPDGQGTVKIRVIRSDAPISKGNSGGGLFDVNGYMCGIVCAKKDGSINESLSIEGITYALPACVVKCVADRIIEKGFFTSFSLGVTLHPENPCAVFKDGITSICEDIRVGAVYYASAAEGLLFANDKIISVKHNECEYILTRLYTLPDLLLGVKPNDELVFSVIRANVYTKVTVTVKEEFFIKRK